jgi:alpha-tubulin suppressor-like RCC1 family protein
MRRGPVVSLLLCCLVAVIGLSYSISSPGTARGATPVGGLLFASGANSGGQLGDGTTTDRSTPRAVSISALPTPTFATVSAGGYAEIGVAHTCAITTTGIPYCWGSGADGQLGDGSSGDGHQRLSPHPVSISALPGAPSFAAISAGVFHTCALTSSGLPYCWGKGGEGQLGDGSSGDGHQRLSPHPVSISALPGAPTFSAISAGALSTCAITTDGVAYCWGNGTYGQLGDGSSGDGHQRLSPHPVSISALPGAPTFSALSVGSNHACALTHAGTAYCWGANLSFALGDGTTTEIRTSPVAVSVSALPVTTFSSIAAGFDHTCAVTTTGTPYCWGGNWAGQLGTGNTTSHTSPHPVSVSALPVQTFGVIRSDESHTCALTTTGIPYCWGSGAGGQLGDGSVGAGHQRTSPHQVVLAEGTTAMAIDTGSSHTVLITSEANASDDGPGDTATDSATPPPPPGTSTASTLPNSTTTTPGPTTTKAPVPSAPPTTPPTTSTPEAVPPPLEVIRTLPRRTLTNLATLVAGTSVTVIVDGFTPGETVHLIVASNPRIIGTTQANDEGVVQLTGTIPSDLAAGGHTLVVYAPSSGLGALQSVTIDPSFTQLPATGARPAPYLALWVIAIGIVLLMARRATRRA